MEQKGKRVQAQMWRKQMLPGTYLDAEACAKTATTIKIIFMKLCLCPFCDSFYIDMSYLSLLLFRSSPLLFLYPF
jgi:hypothetical protein